MVADSDGLAGADRPLARRDGPGRGSLGLRLRERAGLPAARAARLGARAGPQLLRLGAGGVGVGGADRVVRARAPAARTACAGRDVPARGGRAASVADGALRRLPRAARADLVAGTFVARAPARLLPDRVALALGRARVLGDAGDAGHRGNCADLRRAAAAPDAGRPRARQPDAHSLLRRARDPPAAAPGRLRSPARGADAPAPDHSACAVPERRAVLAASGALRRSLRAPLAAGAAGGGGPLHRAAAGPGRAHRPAQP